MASQARFGDDRAWRWIAFSPALAVMLALGVLPVVNLGAMSFFRITWVEGRAIWDLNGLGHYAALADDALFGVSLRNTALFAALSVAVQMVLGFALALLCARAGRGGAA